MNGEDWNGERGREGKVEKIETEKEKEKLTKNAQRFFYIIFYFRKCIKLKRYVRLPAMFIQYVLPAACLHVFLSFCCVFHVFPLYYVFSLCGNTETNEKQRKGNKTVRSLHKLHCFECVCVCVLLPVYFDFSFSLLPYFFVHFLVEPFSGPLFNFACNWLFWMLIFFVLLLPLLPLVHSFFSRFYFFSCFHFAK